MKVLIANTMENIGLWLELDADLQVDRMNKQTNTTDWHKDYSDIMYCPDETDDDMVNPCERYYGYCFITSSHIVETHE